MTTTHRGPIACDLTKVPAGVRERLEADLRALFAEVEEVTELPEGYALRWAPQDKPGLLTKLGEIIDHDRLCCPFIRHAIVDEPWGGPVRLELTGATEVQAFLAAELGALLPREITARAGLQGACR